MDKDWWDLSDQARFLDDVWNIAKLTLLFAGDIPEVKARAIRVLDEVERQRLAA